ncbi:hypothetical protein ACQ0QQ_04725 [Lysinibacillus sphaericus]
MSIFSQKAKDFIEKKQHPFPISAMYHVKPPPFAALDAASHPAVPHYYQKRSTYYQKQKYIIKPKPHFIPSSSGRTILACRGTDPIPIILTKKPYLA